MLIDFGDAIIVEDEAIYEEFVGTPCYLSPERFYQHYGWQIKKSDIWAIGVILYELIVGTHCFEGKNKKEIFLKILANNWRWPDNIVISESCRRFVEVCICCIYNYMHSTLCLDFFYPLDTLFFVSFIFCVEMLSI